MSPHQQLPGNDSFLSLISESVRHILAHEDFPQFIEWLATEGMKRWDIMPGLPSDGLRMAAIALGRTIWNATPLPGNGFRPRPVPEPGRNDPCPCGSGRKYKQCCAGMPGFPAIDPQEMWAVAVGALNDEQFSAALAQKRIPPLALFEAARRLNDADRPQRAAQLLEPLFEGPLDGLDERFELHLDLVCDTYLVLGDERKKLDLLNRVAAEGPRPLAGAAWMRLATVRQDGDDLEAAWQAFGQAQRLVPDHPSIGILEVTMLVAEGRSEHAKQRAAFWAARLRRNPEAPQEVIEFLERAAQDAPGALARQHLRLSGSNAAARVAAWIEAVAGRPIPPYTVAPPPAVAADDEAALRRALEQRLREMGVPKGEVARQVSQTVKQLQRDRKEMERSSVQGALFSDEEASAEASAGDSARVLSAPAEIVELEEEWRAVFPMGKPFSTAFEPFDESEVWEGEVAECWIGFLEQHPQACDSVDVLDDLATALYVLAGRTDAGLAAVVLIDRLAERACGIFDRAVGSRPEAVPWAIGDNRPLLRLIARRVYRLEEERRDAEALSWAQRLIACNPEDNHGFRGLAMNLLLARGEDDAALALAARYPDDTFLEITLGRVLAHFRKGEQDAARQALGEALPFAAEGVRQLCAKQGKRPRNENPLGVVPSGEEEAWGYREKMQGTWAAVPGLLDWLAREARAFKKGSARTAR